ncbi:pleckstrin homology domain-containing family G member 3 isoform X1 [Kryptolebias marmoratus]|uniref:pleckstrin homology domain-containing family G member 3 isoform X1 n=2 Tax=Kryptolebias marmoratus TaxID=37003 RepID=UPI0007F88470|nr:pleckstrin homology domain-containing family G member 3 isoform X1 [Kryptolebias marmoratus]
MPEGSHSALHQGPMGEESPQLSSPLSTADHVQDYEDMGPDYYSQVYAEPLDGEGQRPVSLVSTLSSGSSRDSQSLFGSTVTLPSSTTPPIPGEEDIDLELSPAEGNKKQVGNQSPILTGFRGHWREQLEVDVINNQWNNNNAASSRTASGKLPHITASPVVTDAMAPNPKLTYVDRVVMEIIETERMYVKDLRSIVEDYLAHIIDVGNLPIQPEQVCALFGNIEDIYEFNGELLQCLDMCENDPVAIAQCFVNKSEYFEIYTQYCNNYPNSVAALTDCMRSKTLAKFFRDRQAALKRSLPLGSYLLKPVQRILKYHLLLQEIAKHYDPDEEGYEVVQEAIDTMTGVAWYINDMKRKHEHAVRVQEIQSLLINWKGSDLTTYGELVLEGTFHVLRAKNSRTLFLFEKMLLITKKRGENYVYKSHISCSTLMLLDNAKDPLLFSVIHFKRPKQPHTVQAKSVEEKQLWSHHIKRLILENHNTILPQKAKDATVDNLNYPGKFQCSPERMMKAVCCQRDSFHLGGRHGRRRSEPGKQIIKSTEAILKHADSEGALLGNRCSLQPATSVSTLASSLGDPESERLCVEDFIPRGDSLEQLSSAESDPKLPSSPSEVGLEQEKAVEEKEGESCKEDVLMGGDQVADFASSVLAAISCWHYRARALLPTHFTTDDQNSNTSELETTTEEVKTHQQEGNKRDVVTKETLGTQINVQELCHPDCVPQTEKSHQLEVDYSQCPESPMGPCKLDTGTSDSLDTSRETGEEEERGSDSSGLQVEETSVLTNGELSEEEEEVLLPSSSVLGQASVIAERYISSLSRRSSLVSEDLGPLISTSPPVDNDVFQIPSTCIDLEKQTQPMATSSSEPQAASEDHLLGSVPNLSEGEHRSTLSKKDHLLIHKIRQYYEHAEHQDVNFSIKRRESLSYIPTGLVRQLSRQLNNNPPEKVGPVHRKGLSRNRPTSWSVFDLPGLEMNQKPVPPSSFQTKAGVADAFTAEEKFRPSSEMLKVWEVMETEEDSREAKKAAEEKLNDSSLDVTQNVSSDTSDVEFSKQPSLILEESEMSTASDLSSTSPPASSAVEGGPGQDSKPCRTHELQDDSHFSPNHLPKIINFRTSIDEDQILQDMGKMRNKVFQLARQYSQRIKNNRPMVWPRNRLTASQEGLRNIPAVHEEKMRKTGKPNLRLSLNACEHEVIHEVRSPSPVQNPSPAASSQTTVPSPQSAPSEAFHWPDVQELRSKYTDISHSLKPACVCTVPNGLCRSRCDGCSQRYNSSSELHDPQTDWCRKRSETPHGEQCVEAEDWPQHQTHSPLCRWGSVDHVLGSLPLHKVQNLQEPARTCAPACRVQSEAGALQDCPNGTKPLGSGKSSESFRVRSLREKFQSLSTS